MSVDLDLPSALHSVASLVLPSLDRGGKKQKRESIWPSADIDSKEILRQLLLSNSWPEIVTYDGPTCGCNAQDHESLYGGDDTGTCALISMYCARTIVELEKQVRGREYRSEGRSKEDEASGLLSDLLAERTVQRIISIGEHLKGALKMGPAELIDIPFFEPVFVSGSRVDRSTTYEGILSMLDQLCKENSRRIAATVIAQATQSAVCIKMACLEEDLFVVFDPHARMDHPNGPGFMLSTSRTTTATFLQCLLDSPSSHDVTGVGSDLFRPLHTQFFTSYPLNPKDSYHRITAYQNEQMLRESFLCEHEAGLSASLDYINLWNTLLGPEAGPSSVTRSRSTVASTASSLSSSSQSSSLRSLPRLPGSKFAYAADTWTPETEYGQCLLEHIKLISKKPEVPSAIKVTYDCAICLETFPVYSSVRLSGCDHRFCRECLRAHVENFLENGRFPIQCPVCLLDGDITDPGNVTEYILNRLHVSQQSTDKYKELKLLQHSVRLECPSCQHSQIFARKEYLQSKVLTCESKSCLHKWCRTCSKAIVGDKGKHSCKGDGFEKLMKKKGWRHCPGCTMPIVKDSGCNHMSCTAPGCHTHFCYKCGKLIVVSATGRNVGEEVTLHYSNGCKQFERKFRCSIQ